MSTKSTAIDDLRRLVRTQLRHLPGEGRIAIDAFHQVVLFQRKVGTKLRAILNRDVPDPETVFWIDPKRIVFHTNHARRGNREPPENRVFHPQRDKGKTLRGSWDISAYRFDDLDIARALKARVEDGAEWQASDFYRGLCDDIALHGSAPWGIRSVAELDARCQYLDDLVLSIRREGFKLSHEVRLQGENKGLAKDRRFGSEITVNIGRNGQYLFQDGRHRLAIAKILQLPSVPVKVLVRHTEWVEFRHFMKSLARSGGASSHKNELYQNPIHPDLQDIASAHGCEDRYKAIEKTITSNGGTFLDIGANLAYFCHRFEDLGYKCFAVEHQPQIALAADRIRISEGKEFAVISEDLFSAMKRSPLRDQNFTVVLALSIFHHFLKRKETYELFKRMLAKLNMDVMIFEPHRADEEQMIGAYINFDEQQFLEFIIENSVLNHAEMIHRCDDGRPIYRLSR